MLWLLPLMIAYNDDSLLCLNAASGVFGNSNIINSAI